MMGTGDFGVPVFRALCQSEHSVVGLVTQPDRARRGRKQPRNQLKELAEAEGVPVFQPERVNTEEAIERLREFDAELYVVAAYGQILSPKVIDLPRLGVINVHASLLPKYRGASPVQYAILNGDRETGVTIMQIQPELDAGPILVAGRTEIRPKETAGELEARLAELAVPLTLEAIEQIESGKARPVPQDPTLVTRAPRLKKEDGRIDWTCPAEYIERQIRAMQPWPKAFCFLQRRATPEPLRVVLLEADPLKQADTDQLREQNGLQSAEPGDVVAVQRDLLVVQTGEGGLCIRRIQPEARREMSVREFLAGHQLLPGDRFLSKVGEGRN